MESSLIIVAMCTVILAGVGTVYYIGLYLYELYIEYFTTDPDPDAPETIQETKWDIEKYRNYCINLVNQIPDITEKLVRGVYDIAENYRKVSYKTPDKPSYSPKPIARRRPLRYRSSEDILKAREEILGISPEYDRGRGKDYWTTEKKMKKHYNDLEKKLESIKDVWDTTSSL